VITFYTQTRAEISYVFLESLGKVFEITYIYIPEDNFASWNPRHLFQISK